MNIFFENLNKWAVENPLLWQIISLFGVLLLASLAYFITHRYILRLIANMVKKSKTEIDDLLFDNKLMRWVSFLPPLLILYNFGYLAPELEDLIQRGTIALMGLMTLLIASSLLTKLNLFYDKTDR